MADKMTKKELEQPDEFHTIGWHALQYLSEHREKFYLGAAAVLLIIILAGAWYFYRLNYENKAQSLYSSAYAAYSSQGSPEEERRGGYLKAVQIYEELVKEYPSSHAATLSFYNMGNLYSNIDDTEKAITAYKTFLKRSGNNDILTALAYHGLGYCYEEIEDYDNALKSFEDSNKRLQGTRFEYINYANIARIYERMGRQKDALEFYRKAAGNTKDPLAEMLIKRKIAALAQ
ncbi:MAG: tetratricopeptide repeat protein [Syntrophales bacterium]|nr:tetratricopeptide repeat protein [Syntrophales bacterium]